MPILNTGLLHALLSLLLSQVSYHNAYNNHEEACGVSCRFINQIDYMYTLVAIVLSTFMLQYSYLPSQLYSAHNKFHLHFLSTYIT